ncbi:D-sedoheptulose 7-phosphate isomerase [bacterium endosymbiont of Pedicinus badii]|uniref:D-sedoheptulose 7-phosphate isomerase n=1 Tax=bacterium endosymbiont of Pedicinus badii TaxID=1719126 RepID=UPI0009BC71DD|nr:D-sedoheptulose 7-phosphate isomerase [bacterium endosymbiont of Pedicinus badii]OQM34278.1 phosphoheptose isomerase [bacterium endosymbiont of Pedicinus badii]
MYKKIILKELKESKSTLEKFIKEEKNILDIERSAIILSDCIKNKKKVFSLGNGGSHCDAMHFAEELTGRYRNNRNPYPVMTVTDPSYITCVSNDFGYDKVFSRYLEAFAKKDDTLFCISTSGNSKNIQESIFFAKEKKMKIIFLTSKKNKNESICKLSDVTIKTPYSFYSDRIQEIHIKIIHILVLIIEKILQK